MTVREDDQLELKKRARRRLVGAAAFASLAVVFLPMVLDEAPPPPSHEVAIRIPGQDAPPPAVVASKAPAAAPVRAEAAAPAAVPAPAAKEAAPVVPSAPAEPAKAAEPTAKVVATSRASGAADVAKAAAKPATKDVAPAKEVPPAKETDAKRAQAILDGKAQAAPHVILIGAFANPGNVKTLQVKLAELGIKTYTEPLDSPQGKKTRLRAGPFPSREVAEKAQEKMKRIGVAGQVAVKP